MAVPIPVTLSMAQPLTKIVPETVAPATGVSMLTLGSQFETVTLTLAEPVSGVASVSVAQTVMVCGAIGQDERVQVEIVAHGGTAGPPRVGIAHIPPVHPIGSRAHRYAIHKNLQAGGIDRGPNGGGVVDRPTGHR